MKKRLRKSTGILLSILMTAAMFPMLPVAAASHPFRDVSNDDWFTESVQYVYDHQLMNGTSDSGFEPQTTMSRAMTVTVLHRMEGTPDDRASGYKDVPAGEWYTDAVLWASEIGVVNGYSQDFFGPYDDVTREQIAAILFRYAEKKGYDVSKRADLSGYLDKDEISDWAEDALAWTNAEGLIVGVDDTTLAPGRTATRAEFATVLMRFVNTVQPDQQDAGTGNLWQYSYAGVEHPYLEAISEYLCKYDADHLEIKDGMIPCITSLEVDNSNESDIRLWGIFDIYNYTLENETLVEKNGKRLLGLFHLTQAENGACTVKEASFAENGNDQVIEELCEGHELALEGLKHPNVTEETRRWYISEYVRTSGLAATHYQPKDRDVLPISYEKQDSPDWVSLLPEAQDTDSLIVVDVTVGSNAVLTMHEKNTEGVWEQTIDEAAFIGKNGLGKTKEGDLKTPVGTFGFNAALGILDDPGCAFEYTKVNDRHYWVGDSNSDRYNQLVSLDEYTGFDVDDSEHIVDYPNAYKYILNTTYNEEGTPGKGSAIFLHCYREERTYTGGCISIPFDKMEYVMEHVRENTKMIVRKQSAE